MVAFLFRARVFGFVDETIASCMVVYFRFMFLSIKWQLLCKIEEDFYTDFLPFFVFFYMTKVLAVISSHVI